MNNPEKASPIFDKNGKEIQKGSKVRISEEGRKALALHKLPYFDSLPNFRGNVISLERGKVIIELTEITSSSRFQMEPEWLIVE